MSGAEWPTVSDATTRPVPALNIRTPHLELRAASVRLMQAALAGPERLAAELGATVPASWPHEFLDTAALRFFLSRLLPDEGVAGWWLRFVVRRGRTGRRALIGSGGYKGPPSADGVLELGYGIVADQRGLGYATEVTQGLVAEGFWLEGVSRIVAHTLPEGTASIRVLVKNGFVRSADPAPAGTLRFELTRARFVAQGPRRH